MSRSARESTEVTSHSIKISARTQAPTNTNKANKTTGANTPWVSNHVPSLNALTRMHQNLLMMAIPRSQV